MNPKQWPKLWVFQNPRKALKTKGFYTHQTLTTPPHHSSWRWSESGVCLLFFLFSRGLGLRGRERRGENLRLRKKVIFTGCEVYEKYERSDINCQFGVFLEIGFLPVKITKNI